MRYFEDFTVGEMIELGQVPVDAEAIVDFARQWDPQPFHVDPSAAASGPFGGLIASGWHTACIVMRLYVDGVLEGSDSRGSPGVEDLRWRAPVRPGDTLTVRLHVAAATPSTRHSDRGTVVLGWEVDNQAGVRVMDMSGRGLFGRRPEGWAPPG